MGRSLEDLTNEGVTFLREPRRIRTNPSDPNVTTPGDVYAIWMRGGGIQKLPRSRGISMGELWGLLAFAVMLGFVFGLFSAPALLP